MRATKRIITGLLLFFIPACLHAQYAAIIRIPFPRQYVVMDSLINVLEKMDKRISSSAIAEMRQAAEASADEQVMLNFRRAELRFEFIHSRITDDSVKNKRLLSSLQALLDEVNEDRYPVIEALVEVNIGDILHYWIQQPGRAFNHYLRAYHLFKNVSIDEYPDRQYSQYSIALLYYKFNDFDNAIKLGREIVSLYPKLNRVSVFTENLIGMSFLKQKQYDSAIVRFNWILDHYRESGASEAWKGIASGNIGKVYYFMGNHDRALKNLETAVAICLEHHIYDNVAAFAAPLASIYISRNDLKAAGHYVEIAKMAADSARSLPEYYVVYSALARYYRETGDYRQAYSYFDSSIRVKDSLESINDLNLKYQAEMMVEKERAIAHEKQMESDKARQILIRNAILVFMFLLMLLILLYLNRARQRNRHRQEQLISQHKLAEAELRNAESQLRDFTQSIIEKNELLDKAATEMEKMSQSIRQLQDRQEVGQTQLPESDAHLAQLRHSVILTDDDWREFTVLFEKVHPGFLMRSREKLPGLSPSEYRFLSLLKIRLNNKEMASMLGVGADAIRQTRSRLKKKTGFSDDAQLESMIEAI